MESKYFINAFGEIDKTEVGSDIARDLEKSGNLFPDYDNAFRVLGAMKRARAKKMFAHGTRYVVTARNLYPVMATMLFFHIPFDYDPWAKFKAKKYSTKGAKNTIAFELPLDCPFCISDLLYAMNEKFGETFHFTILSEITY